MRLRTRNDLSILGSGLLGLIGLSLLLFPPSPREGLQGLPWGALIALGAVCFTLSLGTQMLLVLELTRPYESIIRAGSILMLFYFSGLSMNEGFYPEASVLLAAGIGQILIWPDLIKRLENVDLLKVFAPILGLATGLCLIFTDPRYEGLNRSPYPTLVILSFFAGALLRSVSLLLPSTKFSDTLFRLQAIPWLALYFILPAGSSLFGWVTPLMMVMAIFIAGVIRWHRLALSEYDVLGRRVLMAAAMFELATLTFLSVLLALFNTSSVAQGGHFITVRQAALLFFIVISTVLYYQASTLIISINSLMSVLTRVTDTSGASDSESHLVLGSDRLTRYLKPFSFLRQEIQIRLNAQMDQIGALSRQLSAEKKRNAQLVLLNELSQQLENQLDQPVSAQLAVNTLERALNCSLVALYILEENNELMLLAAAGPQTSTIPPGYHPGITTGAIGRAIRQRKTQIINDIQLDTDYVPFENEQISSCVIVPMIFNGHVSGVLALNHEQTNAFGSIEIGLAESVAEEITRAWERSGYHQRLMNLIQSGSQLSSVVEPESTAREVAAITRQILNARFTFVQIQLGQESNFIQIASSGEAPKLLASLQGAGIAEPLIQAAFHAAQPFRVRDVRKYSAASRLEIDHASLRSMLAIPIRWHRLSIGAILAFGKQNEVFFTGNDESLAELLSVQAAGAFESTWLQQELRASLTTTSLLYRLSTQIIQAENLHAAALDIAQTAHKLAKGISAGIVLFSSNNTIEAEVEIDSSGSHSGQNHPMETIMQVMESGQLIYISQGRSMMQACLPIQTPIRKYGALWINIPEGHPHKPANPADLQTLVNQTAIALERSLLLVESRRQAQEIKNAYITLESTYDQTLAALTSALDARDSETEGHSLRVSQLVAQLGETLGFSRELLKVLERGSLLHDIGKIGISDSILHKPGPLDEEEWKIMRQHPDIGARIVEGIPFLEETIPLIRHHQERWNGTGYPLGLKGRQIPDLARIFAVVDAYDALTNDRPYRKKISCDDALQYLRTHAGVLFDPEIVDVFEKLMLNSEANLAVPE
jgi:putative nucleotidyltransferase with HDIG domain